MSGKALRALLWVVPALACVAACSSESASGPAGDDASPAQEGRGPRDATTETGSPEGDATSGDAPLDRSATGDDTTAVPGVDASDSGDTGPAAEAGEGGGPLVCGSVCPSGTSGVCPSTCSNDVYACGTGCANCWIPGTPANTYGTTTFPYGTWPACINRQCASDCAVGFASCSGRCVDENTDASNCGSCGHGCNGGVCVGGQCTTLASIQVVAMSAQDIAVDAANLYATDKSDNVWQIEKNTFTKTLIAGNQATPWDVTFDGSFVYWTSRLGSAVLRAPIGAGAFQVLYSANTPSGIAVDATNVYWADKAGIHAAPKAGQGTVTNLSGNFTDNILYDTPLAQDATRIYSFVRDSNNAPGGVASVFSVDKTTGAAIIYSQYTGNGFSYGGVAVDDVNVYYFTAGTHTAPPSLSLGRQPKRTARRRAIPCFGPT